MRYGFLAILAICMLVVVSAGCENLNGLSQNGLGGNSGNSGTQGMPTYNKGTTGITMNFLTNSPPSDLFDGQSFPFSLEIYNTGNTTTNPYITLSGFDKNIIQVDWSNRPAGEIPKKSVDYPTGGYGSLTEDVRVALPPEVPSIPTTIKATACYEYMTDGTVQLCVDPDPTNNKDDVCSPKTISISEGQAAPVAITSIVQQPAKGITSFIVTLKNVGGGDILSVGKVSQCMTQLPPPDVDVAEVTEGSLGTQALDCTPKIVRFTNGQGVTNCRISGLTGNAYSTSFALTLKYGYKSSITKSVTIRRM